jgi:hypothetical protein
MRGLKTFVRNEAVRRLMPYSGVVSGLFSESARMLELAFSYVLGERIEGDYAEFGVYEGAAFVAAWHAARRRGLQRRRFHAFDSFAGLPEIGGVDLSGAFRKGEFHAPRKRFEENLRRGGVELSRVTVTEGMFAETLTPARRAELGLEKVAVALVDCDLYASAVPVLEFLTHLLVDGAVLIFDDWYCFKGRPDRGEQRACAEWLAANPDLRLVEYQKFHWAGLSFLVHREGEVGT